MLRLSTVLVLVAALPLLSSPASSSPATATATQAAPAHVVTSLCIAKDNRVARLPRADGSCTSKEKTLVMRPSARRGVCLRDRDVRRVGANRCDDLGGDFRRVPDVDAVTVCVVRGRKVGLDRAPKCAGRSAWTIGNRAPQSLALRANVLVGEQPAGSLVGAMSVTEADRGDHVTYRLISGAGDEDNDSFEVVDGLVRATVVLAPGSHSIRVRARDLLGASTTASFTIVVQAKTA